MKRVKKKQNKQNTLQLEYVGNVTVQVVKNNEVVKTINGHNSGTYRLFEYIAKCLIGLYESIYSPKYIQVFHTDNPESVDLSVLPSLAGVLPLSSSTYVTDVDSSTAKLTFIIPGASFVTGAETPNYFALYSYSEYENVANPMATYYLNKSLGEIDRTSNIIVVWELKIGNATFE